MTLLLHYSKSLEKCEAVKYFHFIFLINMSESRENLQSSSSANDKKQSNQCIYSCYTDTLLSLRMMTPFWKCNKGKYFGFCSIVVLCDKPKRILNYSREHRKKKKRITLKTYIFAKMAFLLLYLSTMVTNIIKRQI